MPKDDKQQGIVLDDKNQEQPADKDRAQTAHKTQPDKTAPQKVRKDEPGKS
jgi:hypothetical protein